jgi:hypothetical protein
VFIRQVSLFVRAHAPGYCLVLVLSIKRAYRFIDGAFQQEATRGQISGYLLPLRQSTSGFMAVF